jgi:RimJ/RimL family protein N-acetyltransferase
MILGKELWRGTRVCLGVMGRDDIPRIASWYQDAEFLRLFDSALALPKSEEQVAKMFEEWQKADTTLIFAVRLTDTGELVGMIHLDGIERQHGVAGIAIGLGPDYWDQGLGTEAMELLMRYAFMEMNLYRLHLTVFEYNLRAQAVYRKLGFQHEGTLRQFLARDGRRWDMYIMGILADEWRTQNHGNAREDSKEVGS